jgi:hypothetical protein
MAALTAIWLAFLAGGSLAVAASAVAAAAALAGADAGALGALAGGGGASAALAGGALAAVAARSLGALRSGSLVAVKGDCPACGEEVYAFVQASADVAGAPAAPHVAHRARHVADCHVCARPIAFDVRVRGASAAPWRRRAHGRIYLVSRAADFFPAATAPDADGGGGGGGAAAGRRTGQAAGQAAAAAAAAAQQRGVR